MGACTATSASDLRVQVLCGLLSNVAEGNSNAFQDLYRLSAPKLLSVARRYVHSVEAAEEVLQESYIGIWRDAVRFDRALSQPMTWMTTIVRYRSLDYLRANRYRRLMTGNDTTIMEVPDPAHGPEVLIELAQQKRLLRNYLSLLQVNQRKAIELAFFSELSHCEVAREMAVPLGTVKTCIRRGCSKLRKEFNAVQGALSF